MRHGRPRDHPDHVPAEPAVLLFGLLGGPVAWSLHLFASYLLVTLACTTSWKGGRIALAVVTVVLALCAIGATALSRRNWRRVDRDHSWDVVLSDHSGHEAFLWVVGTILGGIFAAAIVLAGASSLVALSCG